MIYIPNYKEVLPSPEIRMYRRDFFSITHHVGNTGVKADEQGYKIVPAGTLVDKDGNVCTFSGSEITGTPVGITVNTVDVTNGDRTVAIYTRGHIKGYMLNIGEEEYSDEIGTAVQKALPEIHVYPIPEASEAV